MQKLIKREDLKCVTEKDAIDLLSKGYALKGQVINQYLIVLDEQLMIIEQKKQDELVYYRCNNLDLPMLVKNSYSVYELKEIPWYESAPKDKPIICYPLIAGKPDKTKLVLVTLNNVGDIYDMIDFIPVSKDELLSYLYVYK